MTTWDTKNLPIEKLYGMQIGYEDNALSVQYDSGRTISWQRNTKPKRRYALSYFATKKQAKIFDQWYMTELGGNGMIFTAPSLEATGELVPYRFVGVPTIAGQAFQTITMEWVEA